MNKEKICGLVSEDRSSVMQAADVRAVDGFQAAGGRLAREAVSQSVYGRDVSDSTDGGTSAFVTI